MASALETRRPAWVDPRSYPFESHFMATDAGRMHYIDHGTGRPILFLHGLPTWSFQFRTAIRVLSRDYRCIAPDLIGFGLSDKPANWRYSAAAHGETVDQLIRHLDLSEITLVAQDFGGPVGISAAFEDIGRFERFVLSNTWLWDLCDDPACSKPGVIASGPLGKMAYLSMNAAPKLVKPLFADPLKFSETVREAYFGPFSRREHRHGALATVRQLVDGGAWYDELWSMREKLVEKQLLFLWGMKDGAFGEKALNRLWHEFPLASVQQVEDAGRMVAEEHPEVFAEAVDRFVRASPPGAYMA